MTVFEAAKSEVSQNAFEIKKPILENISKEEDSEPEEKYVPLDQMTKRLRPESVPVNNLLMMTIPKHFDYKSYFKLRQFNIQQSFTKQDQACIDISDLFESEDGELGHMKQI